MSAWGRTGRVTLDGEVLPWVRVDEAPVGWVYTPDENYAGWGPRTLDAYYADHLPSLDAAVMWVLRRVDPKLWREERGAWLVRKARPGERIEQAVHTGRPLDPEGHLWFVMDPHGVSRDACMTQHSAFRYAASYARGGFIR